MQKNISEVKGIMLLESAFDMVNGKICNLCYYQLVNIFKSGGLTDKMDHKLTEWGVKH